MGDGRIAPISDAIAERVRTLRNREGLRRDELAAAARAAGLPETFTGVALGNIETGRRDPAGNRRREVSVDELVALAAALGTSPLDLLADHAAIFGASGVDCPRCAGEQGAVERRVRDDVRNLADPRDFEPSLAEQAYVLAAAIDRITSGRAEPKGLPSLTRELRATLGEIQQGRRGFEDPDDDEDEDDLGDLDRPE